MGHDLTIDPAQSVIVAVKGDPLAYPSRSRLELDLSKFHSGRWALQLDAAFARRSAPAVIVAQGVACLAVAWWAQLSPRSYMGMIAGALFVSPLSVRLGQEGIAARARLSPPTRLPFPSVVVRGAYPLVERMLALADSWGSHFVETDAPIDAHPSNRRRDGTAAEMRLLALLPLLDGPGPSRAVSDVRASSVKSAPPHHRSG